MVSQISVLGVTFHTYGFILGLSAVAVIYIFQHILELKVPGSKNMEAFFLYVAVGTVLGARLWHVATDFWLYQHNPIAVLYIWNGGLSIFGALLGGGIALEYARRRFFPSVSRLFFFDAVALSVPVGQSIGRWANFVNQELYGKPTSLPWAISIDPSHRVAGYETFSTFHPLFLYESLVMAVFVVWLWRQRQNHIPGSGYFMWTYLFFYAVLRFLLDFLRIGIPQVWLGMSANQLVLLGCMLAIAYLRMRGRGNNEKKQQD